MSNYDFEARNCYGDTDANREHTEKTKAYLKEKWTQVNEGLMSVFEDLSACKAKGARADSDEVQALVSKLQTYITANYYTCTDDILAGLGKMYVCDERFKKNIDKNGDGTAEFASNAIEKFCKVKKHD